MTDTIRFPIIGMTCGSCVNRITRALKKVDGVTRVRVDLGGETATVTRQPGVTNAALAGAISRAGYEADLSSAVAVDDSLSRGLLAWLLGR
ncbi:MAG: heavy metal-associated domain-containing protein [Chloroflexota bacterium]|nr:heavy metal-associated domain-containing protein [Chloroflexota bacterium]